MLLECIQTSEIQSRYDGGGHIRRDWGRSRDEVEVIKSKKPRKTRLLNKDEKKALLDMLSDLASNSSDIVHSVISIVTQENHIHLYKEREKLWSSLQSAQSLMSTY